MAIVVREARDADKGPLMDFIKNIWGGQDYVPRVWDEWMRDKRGKMFVVEVEGRQVGMNRVRFMEDGLAWLEGARIHPDYRGRGLGSMLGRKSIETALKRGVKVCRLTSGSRNWPAHKQVAKIGFREIARMSLYVPKEGARFAPMSGVRRAVEKDIPELSGRIFSSKEYRAGGGVYWDGFTAVSLTPDVLTKRVKEGSALVAGEAVVISRPGGEGREGWRQVCFATGERSDLIRIIKHVFGRKERRAAGWRVVFAPQQSPLIATLRRAGFQRWSSFVLFERRPVKS